MLLLSRYNSAHHRIEVARGDGYAKRAVVWKGVASAAHLVVHSVQRFIAFVNVFGRATTIHVCSLFNILYCLRKVPVSSVFDFLIYIS